MKEIARRMIKVMLVFCAIIGLSVVLPATVKAETRKQTIEVGKTYDISCTGGIRYDYEFKMPACSYIKYKITPVNVYEINLDKTKDFFVYDHELRVNECSYYFKNGVSENGTISSIPFNLKAGQKMSVCIQGDYSNCIYKFKLKIVSYKKKNFEKESNNSLKNASKLTLNTTYKGNAQYKDTDYWVFTAPSKGKYTFSAAALPYAEDTYRVPRGIHVELKKSKVTKLDFFNVYIDQGYKSFKNISLKKGQKIYICINYEYDTSLYNIKVKKVK